jgi:hypothetical protein
MATRRQLPKPTCQLCQGTLVCLRDVLVMRGDYKCWLAWVCTTCSTAYPIAVHKGIVAQAVPLYSNGRAYDEE